MLSGERKAVCPHCGRPWGGVRYGITFGKLAVRIIDCIERAGPDGIEWSLLHSLVYAGRRSKRSALKAYVNTINDRIRPEGARITARGGTYRMEVK